MMNPCKRLRGQSVLKIVPIFLMLLLIPGGAGASGAGGINNADGQDASTQRPSDEQIKILKERIQKAVDAAQKAGETNINIDLDALLGEVQKDDLVSVNCTTYMDGQVVSGSKPVAFTFIAGEKTLVPGLGLAVIGMKEGEHQTKAIPAEQAYGERKAEKIKKFPRLQKFPVTMKVITADYQKRFKSLPAKGEIIQVNPYFKSKVLDVEDDFIQLENLAEDGQIQETDLGKTSIRIDQGVIEIRLDPVMGADFFQNQKRGWITDIEDASFTVDFNHPFAGKQFVLDYTILSLQKASYFTDIHLPWIDDYDQGLQAAKTQKKNEVLVLYADWCQWCTKMFEHTFEDPRIKQLKDEFIWVKANSDKDESLMARYGQDGFPMIVLLDDKGTVIKKISGFKAAPQLLPELKQMINHDSVKADT
nr:thioredoxin family protein [uncultured Desulfobacter sp.]